MKRFVKNVIEKIVQFLITTYGVTILSDMKKVKSADEPRFSTVDSFLRYIPNNINIERWNEDGSPEE
jgi:hypothetical protein